MLVTPEDAKGRQCPLSRAEPTERFTADSKCMGDQCMMWSWEMKQTNAPRNGIGTWPQPDPTYARTGKGFCGLGRP